MKKLFVLIAVALSLAAAQTNCPANSLLPNLESSLVTLSSGADGNIALVPGVNYYCYNYTLQTPFSAVPQVTIGMNEAYAATNALESSQWGDLSYSISPLRERISNTLVPIAVNANSSSSRWTIIQFNVLAEARPEIEVGTFLADSSLLTDCAQSSKTNVGSRLVSNWPTNSVIRVFLSGFLIDQAGAQNDYTLSLSNATTDGSSIFVDISKNSAVKVNNVRIGYFIYNPAGLNYILLVSDNAVRDLNGRRTNTLNPDNRTLIPNQFLFGVTGFSVRGPIGVSVRVDPTLNVSYGSTNPASNVNAMSYTTILISRPVSEYCVSCPPGSQIQGLVCVLCPAFSSWQLNACQCNQGYYNISGSCQQCPPGTSYNIAANQCQSICQANSFWQNGQCICAQGFFNISGVCQQCSPGTVYTPSSGTCTFICGSNSEWRNGQCICIQGYFNISGQCQQCPSGTTFNNGQCIQNCQANAQWLNGRCVCNQGLVNVNGLCQPCPQGSYIIGDRCQSICPGNSFWQSGQCLCNAGFYLIQGQCQQCPGGTVFKDGQCQQLPPPCPANSYNSSGGCVCNAGFYNVSGQCQQCPENAYWDGRNCNCLQNYYNISGKCQQCPIGTSYDGTICRTVNPINCGANAVYDGRGCKCITGFYNQSGVCLSCQPGSVYNEQSQLCVPQCLDPNSEWNNNNCACKSGFNNISGLCQRCGLGTVWNGSQCVIGSAGISTGTIGLATGGTSLTSTGTSGSSGSSTTTTTTITTTSGGQTITTGGQTIPISGGQTIITGGQQLGGGSSGQTIITNQTTTTTTVGTRPVGFINPQMVSTCPPNSYVSGNMCQCNTGYFPWNNNCYNCPAFAVSYDGTKCVCGDGYVLSNDGNTCLKCPLSFISSAGGCVCPTGTFNISGICAVCPIGFVYLNGACGCSAGTYNISGTCQACPTNTVFNGTGCACAIGTFLINGFCAVCPINSYFNGTNCACNQGYVLNAAMNGCNLAGSTATSGSTTSSNGTTTTTTTVITTTGGSSIPTTIGGGSLIGGSSGSLLTGGSSGLSGSGLLTGGGLTAGSLLGGGSLLTGGNLLTGGSSNSSTTTTTTVITSGSTTGSGSSSAIPLGGGSGTTTTTTTSSNCPSNSVWNGRSCECISNYYLSNGACLLCPANSVWNGLSCVCPRGTNLYNGNCVTCPANGGWDGTKCACSSGFFFIGGECVKCGPNTVYDGKSCVCNRGYYQTSSGCALCNPTCGTCSGPAANQCLSCTDVTFTLSNGICSKGRCDPATYFDATANQCKKCSPFCSTCVNDKTCTTCQDGFNMTGGFCTEICGDGKRFVLPCDDGNIVSGDGCSSTCQIESGYNCRGGSTTSKDTCVTFAPSKTIISPRGKVHVIGKVTAGYRLNYIPAQLLKNGCPLCSQILMVKQISGDSIATITENYIPQTQYSINVAYDFNGIEPIPNFSVTLQINPALAQYFSGVDISQVVTDDIDPSLLALNQTVETLSLDGGN